MKMLHASLRKNSSANFARFDVLFRHGNKPFVVCSSLIEVVVVDVDLHSFKVVTREILVCKS